MLSDILVNRVRSSKGTSTDAEQLLNQYQAMQDIIAMQKTKLDRLEVALREIEMAAPRNQPEINDYPSLVTHTTAMANYILAEIARAALYGGRFE